MHTYNNAITQTHLITHSVINTKKVASPPSNMDVKPYRIMRKISDQYAE